MDKLTRRSNADVARLVEVAAGIAEAAAPNVSEAQQRQARRELCAALRADGHKAGTAKQIAARLVAEARRERSQASANVSSSLDARPAEKTLDLAGLWRPGPDDDFIGR